MAQKRIGKIYDATSASGGSLTPSFSTLEDIDGLLVYFITAGAAQSGAVTITAGDAKDISGTTPSAVVGSYPAPAAGGSIAFSVGPGGPFDVQYVPSKLSFSVTAGAASTTRLVIYAVRMI